MIYITLPEFFYNYNIINKLKTIPSSFFKKELSFASAKGNFPGCYWNGGFNNNIGTTVLYQDIISCIEKISIPIRFNCSNIFMTDEDLNDTFGNFILDKGRTGANQIAISNLEFFDYFSKEYPEYDFVFSREADLIYPMSEDIINTIIEQDIFKIIEIPVNKTKDLDFLKKIKNKSKIEVELNSICNLQCNNFKGCKYHEHRAQYDYSGINNFLGCNKSYKHDLKKGTLISYEELDKYISLGINHFSFSSYCSLNGNEILLFIVNYFIKEEYKEKVIQKLLLGGNFYD